MRGEVRARPGVVAPLHILGFDTAPVHVGDVPLELENALGFSLRIIDAGKCQHPGDVRSVCIADRGHRRRSIEVVVAIGKLEATLQQKGLIA